MKTHLIAALACLALVGACATATPYQPAGSNSSAGGYAEQQIEQNRFVVSFNGNSLTDRRTVETYLLYRAAEVTDQSGFDWFQVVRRQTDEDTRLTPTSIGSPFYSGFFCDYAYYGRRGRIYPRGFRGSRARFYDPFYDPFYGPGVGYREITRFEASAEIILGRGEKPSGAEYFQADDVLINLAGTIRRPEAG